MFGDGRKIEWPFDGYRLAGVEGQWLAPGEAISIARRGDRAERVGIERQRCVDVQIAPEQLRLTICARAGICLSG
jgi:hypothetical protein